MRMNNLRPLLPASLLLFAAMLTTPTNATAAQVSVGAFTISGDTVLQVDANSTRFSGHVLIQKGNAIMLFAENALVRSDDGIAVVDGNVKCSCDGSTIGAERATVDLKSQLAKFTHAYATFQAEPSPIYAYAETLEQIDGTTYRLADGSVTTSREQTPSWNAASGAELMLRITPKQQ